ncbi:MAG: chlorite dismutase family protein [bacterium]|nr:chlorite dismutase family protein [bacterium]
MPCHSYIFFDREPSITQVPEEVLKQYKDAFVSLLEHAGDVGVAAYATLGFKPRTRFMLHLRAAEAGSIQHYLQTLMRSAFGKHLTITHTFLGLVRPSQYNPHRAPEEKEFVDGAGKYLIVYPFTKTPEWHLLPLEERREMMREHVHVARTFSTSIRQLLLYAYGIDDHEFIVSYQCDRLLDFQTLVMELRSTKGRAYTKNDTPIFLCTHVPLSQLPELL